MTDREELKRLESEASPGPWKGGVWQTVWGHGSGENTSAYVASETGDVADDLREHDAEFIVAARNALPSLLAELAEKDTEIERYRALIADLQAEANYPRGHSDWSHDRSQLAKDLLAQHGLAVGA